MKNFTAEYITMTSVQAMWIRDEGVTNYTVTCALGNCEPSFRQRNDNHVMFSVNNYTALNVCLTAENICDKVMVCTEVFPTSTTEAAVSPVTHVTISTPSHSTVSDFQRMTSVELGPTSTIITGMFVNIHSST